MIGKNSVVAIGVFVAAAFVGLLYVLVSGEFSGSILEDRSEATVQIGDAVLFVEIRDTPEGRVKGLSGRTKLPSDRGMLFVHEEPGMHGYWMKDMRFPVDILWIDEDLRVVETARNVSPESYPTSFRPRSNALYALETNAGWANAHNVTKGSKAVLYIP